MTPRCPCGPDLGLREAIRLDLDRAVVLLGGTPTGDQQLSMFSVLRAAVSFPGALAVLCYRIAHALCTRLPDRFAVLQWIPTRVAGLLFGVYMLPSMHAGPGLIVIHVGNVYVGARSVGSNCTIAQGVTVGRSTTGDGGDDDMPTLGDRVWIGANAVVAGGLVLGDDAVVSANTLVTRDVPAAGVAVGVPARVVSRGGSFRQVRYRGMDDDPARIAAMATLAARAPAAGS